MNDLLLDVPPTLSPRLLWMAENRIQVDDPRPLSSEPFRAYVIFNPMLPTLINHEILSGNRGITFQDGYGQTEDEAITSLAKALSIRLWNESQFHREGGVK